MKLNSVVHRAVVARIYRKQQMMVERAVDEYGRRQLFCDNGGNPDDFVSAPELPARITDPLYNPR